MSLLRLRQLRKAFGGLAVVNELDFDVEPGGVTSVIGPNGAGKTTLFNLITGRVHADGGSVAFRDRELAGLPPDRIARLGIARSFQITNVFPSLTVLENARLAAQATSPSPLAMWRRAAALTSATLTAHEMLSRVGLAEHADRPAGTLSHGDQRHLEIAMALATRPALLMLDEPTAGMSALETAATMRLIEEIGRELTVLIIEHNIDLVMTLSRRVMVMAFGRKIADGAPADVARDPEVRRVYLGG